MSSIEKSVRLTLWELFNCNKEDEQTEVDMPQAIDTENTMIILTSTEKVGTMTRFQISITSNEKNIISFFFFHNVQPLPSAFLL